MLKVNGGPDAKTLSGGDVVCKEVNAGGGLAGMMCSAISWCTGQVCLTSGDYQAGDVLFKPTYGAQLGIDRVGAVSEVHHELDMPSDACLCALKTDDDVLVAPYRSHGIKLGALTEDEQTHSTALQVELTEPFSGRRSRLFAAYDRTAGPPHPGVIPVSVNTDRLQAFHQGSLFRAGNRAVCVFNGILATPTKEYAACYRISNLCKFHPELCAD
ncbi:hypothetical protein DIPPA_25547 [Diplonema papillatum]|nr:hypothetical protein DIPPA_25547 [Diplonema papillatum]